MKGLLTEKNIKKAIMYAIGVSLAYFLFLVFSPILPLPVQDKISRITGFGVIVVMLMSLGLLFYCLKGIKGVILRFGIIGCVGTIIMYALWLTIDYGSKHPYASATGFNMAEITLGIGMCYLLLERIIKSK